MTPPENLSDPFFGISLQYPLGKEQSFYEIQETEIWKLISKGA